MVRVKVSSTYHVLIPKELRQSMNIQVGQEVDMIAFDNLKGMNTTIEREEDRSL